jgi:hypothetical protein
VSNNRVQWQGLTEFRTALRHLPEELTGEATDIVDGTSDSAHREIAAGYPQGPTGNLRRGVSRERQPSKFGASAIVRSRARHSHIFEKGTGQRQTRNGANRGSMPEAPREQQMIPVVIKYRRRMFESLKDLVRRAGFIVE